MLIVDPEGSSCWFPAIVLLAFSIINPGCYARFLIQLLFPWSLLFAIFVGRHWWMNRTTAVPKRVIIKGTAIVLAMFLLVRGVVYSSFHDLIANPDSYANQVICVEGTAVSSFEASAISAGTNKRDGATYLTEPAIWLENVVPESKRECFITGLPPIEFCRVHVCGLFESGGGFGHLGGYEFQLVGREVGATIEPPIPVETVMMKTAVPPQFVTMPTPILLPEPTGKPSAWNGRATYASSDDENAPQFSLNFDQATWELLLPTDNRPAAHLSHRQQAGCTITPAVGMGLSDDWTVKNGYEIINSVGYEIFQASQGEELRFINYCTAAAESYTCFTVQLPNSQELCQQAAEELLGTITFASQLE